MSRLMPTRARHRHEKNVRISGRLVPFAERGLQQNHRAANAPAGATLVTRDTALQFA
jgi:hypothetical protein